MMEKFKFNKNSVCTNPNVIRREDGQCSFEIDTAIGRYERWVYGCSCNLISTGFGSPCMDKAQYPLPSYPTEKDAIKAACKEIRKFLAKNTTGSDPNKAGKTVKLYDKKLVSLLDEIERPQPKELSLFGFDYCDNIQCDRMTICGRTEVNGTFPYIHIAYPVRGLAVIVGCLLLAYYTNQIKF